MDYGRPDYFDHWKHVDQKAFDEWLASPDAPDYVVHIRYSEKDYFVRHDERHFASRIKPGVVLIDPVYLS